MENFSCVIILSVERLWEHLFGNFTDVSVYFDTVSTRIISHLCNCSL